MLASEILIDPHPFPHIEQKTNREPYKYSIDIKPPSQPESSNARAIRTVLLQYRNVGRLYIEGFDVTFPRKPHTRPDQGKVSPTHPRASEAR